MNRPPTATSSVYPGSPDGDELGAIPVGYATREPGIVLDQAVPANGYLWWYVDAISDDGTQAMTLIVFVGSVFSPYYAKARKRRPQNAEAHCAFNTILYGPGSKRLWSMTERAGRHLRRTRERYELGPSSLHWGGGELIADVDERCAPFPRRMRGQIRVTPAAMTGHTFELDENAHHRWHPLAPISRVSVDFPELGVSWEGDGYLDQNDGNEPLADGFTGWDWTRARLANGDCAVHYEARSPHRQPRRLALRFDDAGNVSAAPVSNSADLPITPIWRVNRRMPSANGSSALQRTLEDTPFYARSVIDASFHGEKAEGVHESLDMNRFEQGWVQRLLPFRMPRRS